MRTGVTCTCALACFVLRPGLAGQSTFSGGVNTVALYVTLVEDAGVSQPRLSANDFQIRDNGQVRPVTQFEAGPLPITIAVLLDDSPSMRASQPSTEAAAIALIDRLKPGDRAMIGVFSRTIALNGNLTGNHDELLEQMHASRPVMAGTALWDAVSAGVSALSEEPGRRVVLMLTDGDDNSSEADASSVSARAQRDGVLVYAVGIRGAERRLSKDLKDLAIETGGWFFELKPGNNLLSTFQRVHDELRTQYLLGFSPAVLDGKVHRLDVAVKARGVTTRVRKSYVAAPPDTAPEAHR
jgi:VWFA-related protein